MTSSSSDRATPALATVNGLSPIDNAVGYQISKRVNLPQLQTEISALSSVPVSNAALSGPLELDQPLSDTNPLVLWIAPVGVDATSIAQAVAAHQPDPNWGVPQVMQDFAALLQNLRTNPSMELSLSDQDTLLRGIALNFAALHNQS